MPQDEKKYKHGTDYDGVVTAGIMPPKNTVIITGNPKENETKLRKVVGNDIPIYFFDGTHTPETKDEIIGQFKADMVRELGLDSFMESEKAQARIIQEQNPNVNVTTSRKVLIVSDEWLSPSLALALQNEKCNVLLALKRPTNILKGSLQRIPYETRLEVAKDCDLVIYEDKSNRNESKELRAMGISVIGGDKLSDRLELDRTWANLIAKQSGILAPEMIEVDSFEKIREIITERGGKWVMKQQGKIDEIKGLNFVAKMDNSEDLLDFLPILEKNWIEGVKKDFVLQEKIEGNEMAIGSFWNGTEFMKDKDGDELCIENFEHKPLFPGGLGESTGEQFTVQRMMKAKHSKLFSETLNKSRELLKQIDYRGSFDTNTIITPKGAYFIEFTPRMGVPSTSGFLEIWKSSWYEFLKAVADGTQTKNFEYDDKFCIVSWLYTKPFPFVNSHKMTALYENGETPQGMEEIADTMSFRMSNSEGILINFKKDFTKEDWKHVHPDGLRFQDGRLKIANPDGYVLTASMTDEKVEGAGEKLNELFKKIIVPKGFWRNDFDKSNYHRAKDELTKWGYLLTDEQKNAKIQDDIKVKSSKEEAKRKEIREKLKKLVYAK